MKIKVNGMKIQWRDRRTNLEKEIDSVLEEMAKLEKNSEEYTNLLSSLDKLCSASGKSKDKKTEVPWVAIITGSVALLQTIMILNHEQLNVITSKAGSMARGRV